MMVMYLVLIVIASVFTIDRPLAFVRFEMAACSTRPNSTLSIRPMDRFGSQTYYLRSIYFLFRPPQ